MSLVTCSACKKQVSDSFDGMPLSDCLACGRPLVPLHKQKFPNVPRELLEIYCSDLDSGHEISEHDFAESVDVDEMPCAEKPKPRRKPIKRSVQREVWQRDGGRCVQCNSNENLCFDHIIPVSLGGNNTVRNIQILCESCNLKKSNKI